MNTENNTQTTISSGQLAKFLQILDGCGVTPEVFRSRLDAGVLDDIFDGSALLNRQALRVALGLGVSGFPKAKISDRRIVEFDYGQVLRALHHKYLTVGAEGKPLVRIGCYSGHTNFELEGEGRIRLETVALDPREHCDEEKLLSIVAAADTRNPWRPAGVGALVGLGLAHPEEGRMLVALGSWGYLENDSAERPVKSFPAFYRAEEMRGGCNALANIYDLRGKTLLLVREAPDGASG